MIFTIKNQDKLYRGKSARKLFPERANYERLTSPQNKKLFPNFINQESLNRQPQTEKPIVRIDKNFGKPTQLHIKENDKKTMLPTEYNQKYSKAGHRHSNSLHMMTNQKGNIMYSTSSTDKSETKYMSPRRNYPYNRTTIYQCMEQKNEPNKKINTKKVNENRFDILKFVPKYNWEF